MERIKNNKLFYTFFLIICLLGIFLRLRLWFYNPGLHCDEASLALNLFDASFSDLFKPLIRLQVAPPLFLVLVKYFYRIVNLHYTPDFSDMMLRLIPLVAGICSIPIFGSLLNSLFKNKFITLLGMLILAVNPCAISYSSIFKQYSTELLITLLIIIVFKNIKFNQFAKFFSLGFLPFISLNSFFMLPGCFCELFIKAVKEKELKKFFIASFVFLIPFICFILFILIPIMKMHYTNMEDYWQASFGIAKNFPDYIKVSIYCLFRTKFYILPAIYFIISAIIMFIKNYRLAFYTIVPIFITYILTVTKHYPLSERFILFLLPLVIIILVYPFTFIPEKIYRRTPFIIYICIAFCIILGLKTVSPLEITNIKQEYGKEAWKYLETNYDEKTPVIIGESFVTNLYYRMFYQNKINCYDLAFFGKNNAVNTLKNLPKGVWYVIITRYNLMLPEFDKELMQNTEILEYKNFHLDEKNERLSNVFIDAPDCIIIKIRTRG